MGQYVFTTKKISTSCQDYVWRMNLRSIKNLVIMDQLSLLVTRTPCQHKPIELSQTVRVLTFVVTSSFYEAQRIDYIKIIIFIFIHIVSII